MIEAYKKDVDRTLIRENLKLTPQQRIEKLIKLLEFQEELRSAVRDVERHERRGSDPPQLNPDSAGE